ncbi:DUF2642 domain-containing protein [Cytobacillus sp. FSL H8-0458]|uniref:DUF2642 domain-containing protein n=1 Tax=Cytobacillus sp. FSL H8-0458 TaxID=2975346 RepID=UPI0030FB3060
MDPMYAYRVNPQTTQNGPMQVIAREPFVYEALRSLKGKRAVLDTTCGSVSGVVVDAKLDHVVIQEYDSTFFVRLREIVWIMPES